MKQGKATKYYCHKCKRDFGAAGTVGAHFKRFPNHRTRAQRRSHIQYREWLARKKRRDRRAAAKNNEATAKANGKNPSKALPAAGQKFCTHCGEKRDRRDLFCGWCGTQFDRNRMNPNQSNAGSEQSPTIHH